MIDVMMFLLVFFVLISLNVIPSLGLKVKLPVSSQVQDSHPPVRVILSVPVEGAYQIDGVNYPSLKDIGPELLRRKQAAKDGITVVIQGDDQVALQRLVDVMDTLKSQGIDLMTIAARRR